MTEKRELDPPVVASIVRIVPHTFHHRTVCMRIELYGCPFSGEIESYIVPVSQDELLFEASPLRLGDDSYDGLRSPGKSSDVFKIAGAADEILEAGLGQLTDGIYGVEDVTTDMVATSIHMTASLVVVPLTLITLERPNVTQGYDWVAWKNNSSGHDLELVFVFKSLRVVHEVRLHAANVPSFRVGIFASAKVFVDSGNGHGPKERLVALLGFGDDWIFLSEVSFSSEDYDPKNPGHLKSRGSSWSLTTAEPGQTSTPTLSASLKPTASAVPSADQSEFATQPADDEESGNDSESRSGTPFQTSSSTPSVWIEILIVSLTLSGVVLVALGVVCAVRATWGHWPSDSGRKDHLGNARQGWFTKKPNHIFASAKVFVDSGNGHGPKERLVADRTFASDVGRDFVRNVSIPLISGHELIIARVVRVVLGFGDDWIFLSEVSFSSEDYDPKNPGHLKSRGSSWSLTTAEPGQTSTPTVSASLKPTASAVPSADQSEFATQPADDEESGNDSESRSGTPFQTSSSTPSVWIEILIVSLTLSGVVLVALGVVCAVRATWGHWPSDSGRKDHLGNARQGWFTKKPNHLQDGQDVGGGGGGLRPACRISLTNEQIVTVGSEYSALDRATLCTEYSLLDDNFCLQQQQQGTTNALGKLGQPRQLQLQQQHCWQSAKDVSNLSSPESIYTGASPSTPPSHFLLAGMKTSATTGTLSTFHPTGQKMDAGKGKMATSYAAQQQQQLLQDRGSKKRRSHQQEQPYATTDILCINNNHSSKNKDGKQAAHQQAQVFFLTQRDSAGELSFAPFQQQASSWSTGNIFDPPRHQQNQQ
ncbi:unnamed protein product [Notodromas monacha]|uniref:F5/8 type C domain-containing protein n=1 Tax=Notodromas monacha TaxID=399045 RepID=A0A7R9GF33_9CRUS|nr:unnamed protein product [Notodromas monacha]CAG0918445.1 unnamed protein product [Notodromas monacha]